MKMSHYMIICKDWQNIYELFNFKTGIFKRNYNFRTGVFGYKTENRKTEDEGIKHILMKRFENGKQHQIVNAFREHGHKIATINPVLIDEVREVPEINFDVFDVSLNDRLDFSNFIYSKKSITNVEDALKYLHQTYCGNLSSEFTYIENFEEREWFAKMFEEIQQETLNQKLKYNLLNYMLKSQALDQFLATKFAYFKRYGGEGAESMMGFFIELLNMCSQDGVRNVVVGAPHRARLNLLTGIFNVDPALIFRKILGKSMFPDEVKCFDDGVSHLSVHTEISVNGKTLNIMMTHYPAHLESASPVSVGMTRCLQLLEKEAQYGDDINSNWADTTINVQVHGDAGLMGQGVSQETLLMSSLPHFNVGGIVHLIINNQLGFTTPPLNGRGTRYASDIAKLTRAPAIHVNGEDPEAVVKATQLAVAYQRTFRKHVFVDLNCFRRWGHNELDDPTFTNPVLYKNIHQKRSIPDIYSQKLIEEGIVTDKEVKDIEENHLHFLNDRLKNVDSYKVMFKGFSGHWKGYIQAPNTVTEWDTGFSEDILHFIGKKSVSFPEHFNIHPHLLKTHVIARLSRLENKTQLDWSTAESLAVGSLLFQGYNVRLSGQDVGRGTFAHRHFMLVDQNDGDVFIPLNKLSPDQTGFLEVANSLLSEEGVLGFEYGFSTISPNNLIIWEAQFGDFFNGAQIQIDTYVTSGETRWMSMSGIVLLLPHGYDGAGSEHSSCRLERFLQLSDSSESVTDGEDVNIHIVNPTTPAQYFHLLRRQMIRNYRKPLIVVAPKILLRSSDATSALSQMGPNTSFSAILGDVTVNDYNSIKKIIFVSGKHYYSLLKYKKQHTINDAAIIRLEELSPFPVKMLLNEVKKYKYAKEFIWSQEEPKNMGAWTFCKTRFENIIGVKLTYCGRKEMGSPAVGIGELHRKEAEEVIQMPFEIKLS